MVSPSYSKGFGLKKKLGLNKSSIYCNKNVVTGDMLATSGVNTITQWVRACIVLHSLEEFVSLENQFLPFSKIVSENAMEFRLAFRQMPADFFVGFLDVIILFLLRNRTVAMRRFCCVAKT
jgi:hypothetical protein